jgi:hypothetical protein
MRYTPREIPFEGEEPIKSGVVLDRHGYNMGDSLSLISEDNNYYIEI